MAGLEVSENSPFLTVRRERRRDERSCCVICVGSTGSGKSSTISIVTGHQVRGLSDTQECLHAVNQKWHQQYNCKSALFI